jgi:hypothetical protein
MQSQTGWGRKQRSWLFSELSLEFVSEGDPGSFDQGSVEGWEHGSLRIAAKMNVFGRVAKGVFGTGPSGISSPANGLKRVLRQQQ